MKLKRVPMVPLVTIDPHISLWSAADTLTEDWTRHWTGARQSMFGAVRMDGVTYRFLGKLQNDGVYNGEPTSLKQTKLEILPLTTVAEFEHEMFDLKVSFMTPLLPNDLKMMSRPVSYISYALRAKDGKQHDVELFFGLSTEAVVDNAKQTVSAGTYEHGAWCGRGEEGMLTKSGDDLRGDWGYLHIFSRDFDAMLMTQKQITASIIAGMDMNTYQNEEPFEVRDEFVSMCLKKKIVLNEAEQSGFICIGYDDIHSIMYFGKPIDAYYKKDGDTFEEVCAAALKEYETLEEQCNVFNREMMEEASAVSPEYASVLALAYRQVAAAHKLTWDGTELQYFSKECFSNGCIGTVDVTYPSVPMFLRYNPDMVEGMLNPIFKYLEHGWPFPFAPHDVGQYPLANGQVYGLNRETNELAFEKQMPIEECGNMLICVNALCRARKDYSYFEKHRAILSGWADYLKENGLDPENQLCTDDFAGHLAHNCNLSVKAILGIASFGDMLERSGCGNGEAYFEVARDYAAQWKKNAFDGDHYRLAFDAPGSWSLKYNLVWDKLFGWNIFDADIAETEVAYYKTKINAYGIPLDSRDTFTKSDWQMWSAWLTDDIDYRNDIIHAMVEFLQNTTDRVPFTDWYETPVPRHHGWQDARDMIEKSFRNRTVQGGLFIGLLEGRLL